MRQPWLFVIGAALSGCSSYKVVKVGADGGIPAIAKGGIPVTLGRPQFVVKKVEGADPEQFQVSVTYVPDPDQRYAVRIGSTPLANADLTLAFSEGGALSSSTAAIKDQVVPTTLALFKVAASVTTALGPTGFLSPNIISLPECLKDETSGQGDRLRCVLRVVSADNNSKCAIAKTPDGLLDRLEMYIGPDQKDKGDPAKSLFARDAREAACIGDVVARLGTLSSAPEQDPSGLTASLKQALADASQAQAPQDGNVASDVPLSSTVRNAASEALTSAIAGGDVKPFKRWYYVVTDPALTPQKFARLVPSPAPPPTPKDAARIQRVLEAQQLKPGGVGLDRVRRIGVVKSLKDTFESAVTLQPATWRSRYIAWLQKRADEAERAALTGNPRGDVRLDQGVRGFREQVAALAGVRQEYDRWLSYQVRLQQLPATPTPSQRLSPASEYSSLRAQAIELEQVMAAAIAAKLGSEPAKKADPLPPTSPWIGERCVSASRDEAWRFRAGGDASPFAVVLRRADGSSLTPVTGGLQCGD